MGRFRYAGSVTAVAVAAASLCGVRTSGQEVVRPQLRQPSAVAGDDLRELRRVDGLITDASRRGGLRLRSAIRDPLAPGRTVERYVQFHRGIRVWGADVIRDSESGVPISVFGSVIPDLALDIDPALSPDAAAGALTGIGGADSLLLTPPEVVILPLESGAYRLAYTAVVSGEPGVVRAFIDAHSGAELLRYSEIQHQQQAVGTGTGVLGDQKKLSTELNAGAYVAFDRHRPPMIQTFDLRGNVTRAKQLLNRLLPFTANDLARDTDNVWTDVSVVDAHAHVSWTYDYYYKRFGRSGLDGRDGPVNILVNALTQQGALSASQGDFDDFAINAFWCGVCGPNGQGIMSFGSGMPQGFFLNVTGRSYTYLSGALDVAAHELTHAVTSFTSQLIYQNESGALNESFSDMMGKSAEFFYHPAGGGVGQADYVIGKDAIRAARAGSLSGIRSMANPGLYGHPDHYSQRFTGAADNGGVHLNSGISNNAFYLAIEGGTNRTSGLAVQGVGAANREQIEKVFYRAFTLLLPPNATFLTARIATIQAARDLYGAGGNVERAVTQAWTAVGVMPGSSFQGAR